jgi:hypothetical protein
MKMRTLSRTFVCCAVALSVFGCGDDDDGTPSVRTERFESTPLREPGVSGTLKKTVCKEVPARAVARALGRPSLSLSATSNNSTDLSVCDWRGPHIRAQMIADSAPRAQLRYFNQLSEQLEFFNQDAERRPYQVKGVGQDSAYGGAGAWWTRPKSQMVAYSHNLILRIRVVGRGLDDAAKRKAAGRLGRLGFRRISAPDE